MKNAKTTSLSRQELGALGEQVAAEHLQGLGWQILQRNWRSRYGELDLIAVDCERTLVFVEVKTRTGDGYGGIEHAVTLRKVGRIRRLAGLWLAGQDRGWSSLRIDVVGVRLGRCSTPEVKHLRGVG